MPVIDSSPRNNIDLSAIEGNWIGKGSSVHWAGNSPCSFPNIPIEFSILDGKATSLILDDRAYFEVPVRADGYISFTYEDIVQITSGDIPGEDRTDDMVFEGWITEDKAEGSFLAASCYGEWKAVQTISRNMPSSTSRSIKPTPAPYYRSNDIIEEKSKVEEKLIKLRSLYEKGLIDESEYKQQKSRILNEEL